MGMFKSICPNCGEEKKNSEIARCKACGRRICRSHFEKREYVKSGMFKDKTVEHYHCPSCGGDNGTFLAS